MSVGQTTEAAIRVRNIGGIDETSTEFSPGVTVLAGENATNRTSLLQAIMAVLGSDDASMKGDAEEAFVELEIDGETHTRELSRQGTTVRPSGDPYLEDSTLADLFAFLLESNEARRAVAQGGDLRELIMRPVDTDEIQREIQELLERRRTLQEEIDQLDSLKRRLPTLEERRVEIREDIAEKRQALEAKEEELATRDADPEETREEKAELEERLGELRSKRSELEDVRYDVETERESLESLRAETREVESELESLPEAPVGEIGELESRIERLRERKSSLESEVNEIQSVIRFNRDMLDDTDSDVPEALEATEEVTDELLPEETVSCWTCGSDVPREQIESTADRLQELSQRKIGDIGDLEDDLEAAREEVQTLREKQRERERLRNRRSELEDEIERSEGAIERLIDRREELQSEIESLETEIEGLESDSYEEVLELHKQANQLEYELGRLEGNLEDVEAEIAELEEQLDAEEEQRAHIEELNDEIEALRTKIDRIERQAVEEFNGHMETVLELLEYGNIERVWLERLEREVREGRRKVTKSAFELHIVRQTDSGATYEDTIDHLSESEREVTGLVFALAGYLAHDVYETVPFMLLDSLEAIDSDRIAALVEYVSEYSDFLVVALLPEDAAALDDNYDRITNI